MSSSGPVTPSSCPEAMKASTLAGALILLLPATAQADRFEHGLSAALFGEYDSNPALSAATADAVWRYSATPSYSLSGASGPDAWNAKLGLRLERSSDANLSAEREDPTVSAAWTRQTPTGSFGFTAGYEEASTRVSEFRDTGLVTADGSKVSLSLAANWSQALNERRTLALNTGYAGVDYRGGALTDYATLSAGATLSQTWDERSEPYLRVSASRYAPAGSGANSDSFDLMAGVSLTGSERLSLDLSAGINHTVAQTSRSGWQGSVKLNYALDARTALACDLGRSVASSGIGGFVESDVLNASWSQTLSDKQSIGANLSWRKSQSAATGDTTQFSLFGSRSLDALWSLRVSYLYKQRAGGVPEASGHVLGLTLSYAHPDFLDF